MASLRELTATYEDFLLCPRLGPGVCRTCFNLTDGYSDCYACAHGERWLDAVAPISYSVGHERLHHALVLYKRSEGEMSRRISAGLAAVLWRFLAAHEPCVAHAAGTDSFPLVTTVPSADRGRDERHPLRRIVAEMVGPTRERHERLLRRSSVEVDEHEYCAEKYEAVRSLEGEPVLLLDDTWTTGASAQGAATELKRAGAGPVAAVVIGRQVTREWHQNDTRLRDLGQPFSWRRCAWCSEIATSGENPARANSAPVGRDRPAA